MTAEVQSYFVFAFVLFSAYKLTEPVWQYIYRKIFPEMKNNEKSHSCYSDACSKCKVD